MTSTERLSPGLWVSEYVSREDGLSVRVFAEQYASLTPVHKAMRGIVDRQAWLDEFSRIQWETSSWRHDSQPIFTVGADELSAWLAEFNHD